MLLNIGILKHLLLWRRIVNSRIDKICILLFNRRNLLLKMIPMLVWEILIYLSHTLHVLISLSHKVWDNYRFIPSLLSIGTSTHVFNSLFFFFFCWFIFLEFLFKLLKIHFRYFSFEHLFCFYLSSCLVLLEYVLCSWIVNTNEGGCIFYGQ